MTANNRPNIYEANGQTYTVQARSVELAINSRLNVQFLGVNILFIYLFISYGGIDTVQTPLRLLQALRQAVEEKGRNGKRKDSDIFEIACIWLQASSESVSF